VENSARYQQYSAIQSAPPSFWLWHLTQAANGENVKHFRTIRDGEFEIKMFFTASRFITVYFQDSVFLKTDFKIRGPKESLLVYQWQLEHQCKALAS
jgi:hypothetical protein